MAAPRTSERRRLARPAAKSGVGMRVRALRVEAGLTQAALGGSRFTKEYVSQVELGKTRPSSAAVAWFAERLGIDRAALEGEPAASVRAACEAAVVRAEADVERHRYADALGQLEGVREEVERARDTRMAIRHALARGWALHHVGRLDEALAVLGDARAMAEGVPAPHECAHALYRLGVVRFKMGSHATAIVLLDEALRMCEACEEPSDALRARIFNARAKVRRRQKDFVAASEDVEQALELAQALNDDRVLAEAYFDASLVADRRNQYGLAREYAERSKALFERIADHEYVGKLLNNLGQLRAYTGRPQEAVELLRESFRIAVELDNRIDAGFAAASLASARLHTGDYEEAVASAERALRLLEGREEYRQEEGNARLVMGRALLAQGRLDEAERAFTAAAEAFAAAESISHMAGAWVALGDVATERGQLDRAAELYRRAAEALQTVRW